MQARGPLMIEHRLIERMIAVVESMLKDIEAQQRLDPLLVDTAVDFFQMYADRTHHGKEEDILFRNLKKKPLSDEDARMMNELIEEHVFGRRTTGALVKANKRYRQGEEGALADIAEKLRVLVEFYPRHIEKEDKVFFPASKNYVTDEEEQSLLTEFWEFDRQLIHEKYRSVVSALEKH
jgi:hemerythrin-like domain-containing protein